MHSCFENNVKLLFRHSILTPTIESRLDIFVNQNRMSIIGFRAGSVLCDMQFMQVRLPLDNTMQTYTPSPASAKESQFSCVGLLLTEF